MTEQERTLIAGCLRGEKASWDAFVLQYSSLVYHTVKKTLSVYHVEQQPDRLDDLFQEFFYAILRDDCKKLRQFKGDKGCSLASWIRVVVARLTIDSLRKKTPITVEVTESMAQADRSPFDALVEYEKEHALRDAIQNLSAKDRIFIELYFRQELAVEEIAAILKVSVGAVYTQKSRLIDKLKNILGQT